MPAQDTGLLGELSGAFVVNCPNDEAVACILELAENPSFRETGIQTGEVAQFTTDASGHILAWATYDQETNSSRTQVVVVGTTPGVVLEHAGLVNGLWLSSQGRFLVLRLYDPTANGESCYHIEAYDLMDNTPLDVLAGYCVWGFAWANTQPQFLAAISRPANVGSTLVRGGVEADTLEEINPRVAGEVQIDLSWSPDDQMVAYRDANNTSQTPEGLHVLEAINGQPVAEAHPSGYTNYAWAPDSTRLAFVGWSPISTPGDRAAIDVHILDVKTGQVGYLTNTRPYSRFNNYDAGGININRVAWLPQSDGVIYLWEIDNQSWIVATSTTGGGSTEVAEYEYHPRYFSAYNP